MKRALKFLVTLLYKPILSRYLSVTRKYTYKKIRLTIPPEVFHPRFFFSTKILLQYISKYSLQKKTFLELGAGSGLISLYAAKKGAVVTATDINDVAVEYLKKNQETNEVKLTVILSDLFNDIPVQTFDIIAINPPYYKKTPESYIDYAWYCGENGEYFDGLFKNLGRYLHARSQVLIILSETCDLPMIQNYAQKNGWLLDCVLTKNKLMEKLFIFKVESL